MPEREMRMEEEVKTKLAAQFILYRMIEEEDLPPVLLGEDYKFIEPVLDAHYDEYWTIEEGAEHYSPTRKGELVYHNFIARWWDFILTYDIFAGVDLGEGVFAAEDADWDAVDKDGRPIWEDLRVAVCVYKKRIADRSGCKSDLNPFTIVFMSLLSERRIGIDKCWQFDLVSDKFWEELGEIVNTNLWPEDLGYFDDEAGSEVLGDDVMLDIIEQGIEETKRRWEEDDAEEDNAYLNPPESMATREEVVEEYEEELHSYGWGYDPFYYNPYAVIGGGLLTAAFIGTVWVAF